MEAILDGPVVMIKDPRTEKNRVIDPGHIGRQLMGFRQLEAKLVVKVRCAWRARLLVKFYRLLQLVVRSSVVLDRVVACGACSLAMVSRGRSLLTTCACCESLCEPSRGLLELFCSFSVWVAFGFLLVPRRQ